MTKSSLPLVSIITPVFNGALYLEPLIQSVLTQKYPNIEHIIIDDGSNDGGSTLDVLKKFSHVRWWTRSNQGQYATMNEGLLAAKGEIICFICADDIISPNAIAKVVKYLSDNQKCNGVYGKYGYINSEGIEKKLVHPFQIMPTKLYPYSLHISHSSFYIQKNALIQNQLLFDDSLKFVGDYHWIVNILKAQLVIEKIKDRLSFVRIHEQQTSKINFFKMREEMNYVQKALGISYIGASLFRKLWFFINLINSVKLNGFLEAFKGIQNRFG